MSENDWPNYGSGIVWSCRHSPSGQCNHKACGNWGANCVLKKEADLARAIRATPVSEREEG